MKKYHNHIPVTIIKELGIVEKSKDGKKTYTWVQIEYDGGKLKGCRAPCILEDLKDK